jgi:Sigma-70 region 2
MDNIPANERDLLRLAKIGNCKAQLQLIENHRRFICKLVNQHSNGSTKQEEMEQEAIIALLECISGFDLDRNNGFRAFIEQPIRKRLRRHAKHCAFSGLKSEANIDRWLHSNIDRLTKELGSKAIATELAKAVVAACGCPLGKAFDAVARQAFAVSHQSYYSGARDQEDKAVGYERREAVASESHDMRQSYGCLDPRQLTPHIGLHRAISRYIDDLASEKPRGVRPPKLKAPSARKRKKRKARRRPRIRTWRSWQTTTQEITLHV